VSDYLCFNGIMDGRLADFWQNFKIPVILGALSLGAVILSITILVKSTQNVTPIRFSRMNFDASGSGIGSTLGSEIARNEAILVDVEGAVKTPGIVRLGSGARVEDAIRAAGGLATNADEVYIAKNINRAMRVVDGMKVYIPVVGEAGTSHNLDRATSQTDVAQSYGIVTTSGGSSQNAIVVSVNSASQSELESLPGVGPVTARKIIDNRPYASLEDLTVKKAIGPALFETIKSQLSL
jgi:competence protein ComEA